MISFGFSVFCLVLAMQLREGAVAAAFGLALGCALAVHLAARRMLGSSLAVPLVPVKGVRAGSSQG